MAKLRHYSKFCDTYRMDTSMRLVILSEPQSVISYPSQNSPSFINKRWPVGGEREVRVCMECVCVCGGGGNIYCLCYISYIHPSLLNIINVSLLFPLNMRLVLAMERPKKLCVRAAQINCARIEVSPVRPIRQCIVCVYNVIQVVCKYVSAHPQ